MVCERLTYLKDDYFDFIFGILHFFDEVLAYKLLLSEGYLGQQLLRLLQGVISNGWQELS